MCARARSAPGNRRVVPTGGWTGRVGLSVSVMACGSSLVGWRSSGGAGSGELGAAHGLAE